MALCKIGRKAFSRSIPGMEEVGKGKACEVMSISAVVASAGGAGGCAAGAKRNGVGGA